jgi:hypothetical protein
MTHFHFYMSTFTVLVSILKFISINTKLTFSLESHGMTFHVKIETR